MTQPTRKGMNESSLYLIEFHNSHRRILVVAHDEGELRHKVYENTPENFDIITILAGGHDGYLDEVYMSLHELT